MKADIVKLFGLDPSLSGCWNVDVKRLNDFKYIRDFDAVNEASMRKLAVSKEIGLAAGLFAQKTSETLLHPASHRIQLVS